MKLRTAAHLSFLLVTVASSNAWAQNRTAILTARGNSEYKSITDVRELASGKLLISDTEGGNIWTLNADGSRSNTLKHGVIQAPGRIRILPGDSALVFGRAASRFSLISPDGNELPANAALTPPEGPMRIGTSRDLYATDGRALFWNETVRDAESAPLWKRASGEANTKIATLRTPPMRRSGSGGITYSMSIPFAPIDEWDIADNGDVVVARGDPYRIDRVKADGALISGPVRTIAPVPVMPADREQVARDQQKTMGSINIGGVSLGAQLPDDAWPTHKAAFGRGALRVAPDGSAWVKRMVAADAKFSLVDVFNSDGSFREALELPAGAEVVGFGARTTFVSLKSSKSDAVTLHNITRQ